MNSEMINRQASEENPLNRVNLMRLPPRAVRCDNGIVNIQQSRRKIESAICIEIRKKNKRETPKQTSKLEKEFLHFITAREQLKVKSCRVPPEPHE